MNKQIHIILSVVFFCVQICLISESQADPTVGKQLSFERKKGNCLACHEIPKDKDATLPGNIGPALIEMKLRYPNRSLLKAQIVDATQRNPETVMPPFGKNQILSDSEIEHILDYLYTI